MDILPVPVKHTKESLPHGLKIGIGTKIISYSGDTEWTPGLKTLADHSDLFLCECTFYEREMKGHLNYQVLKKNAGSLKCKRMLLTHLGNEMAAHHDDIAMECAFDGMKISI